MSTTNELATVGQGAQIAFTSQAELMRSEALAVASLIQTVDSDEAQGLAVAAQRAVREVMAGAESARVEFKRPHLDANRQIDALCAQWVSGLEAENLRLAKTIGNWQSAERARIADEQAAHNARLMEIERQRAEACRAAAKAAAEATDAQSAQAALDARQAVMEDYAQKARELGPRPEVAQAKGQRVTQDWVVTVNSLPMLASAYPGCVKITPVLGEIKALLKAGVNFSPAILTAELMVSSGVSTRQRAPIAIAPCTPH